MAVLKFLFIILEVLVLFNLLIFVHELGHFLAARWRGLKIERFAIWFGKPIWKKKIRGVEFCLGCIPAGGYVSLPQMAPMELIEGKTEEPREHLPTISALDKIIVAFAGPLFSFLLALAFALVVWVVGRPVSQSETTTTIGYVLEDGPADKAGLKAGDRVLEVDGEPVSKWGGMGDSIKWRVVRSEDPVISVKVERDHQIRTFEITPRIQDASVWQRKNLREISIGPAQSAIVGRVHPNSPAELAGLRPGDEILSLNGQKLVHFLTIDEHVAGHPDEPVTLLIARDGKQFEKVLKPERPVQPPEGKPDLGILYSGGGKMDLAHPKPVEQVRDSVNAMVSTFGALLSRKSDIKAQHLGGAIKIINVYYTLFESEQGWRLALWFSVLMNVNLALLNLLPIPVLDGGHIVLAILEGIRRKPVSVRLLQYLQTACAAALILFMLYIAFYDVQDLRQGKEQRPPEVRFAPKPNPDSRPAP